MRATNEREVASAVLSNHCHVTNVRTDPGRAGNRMAPIPSGQVGTCHGSRAVIDTSARPTVPTAMAAALNVTGFVSWPHRLIATVAKAAHVADRMIASMGNALSSPAVPTCPQIGRAHV